ncbi:MAG: hypothetical protein EA344_10455 [Alkalicoccus sp.]|nr:MAG: hypothetical protein EA344_10455 [Alkalicoccus sp.]
MNSYRKVSVNAENLRVQTRSFSKSVKKERVSERRVKYLCEFLIWKKETFHPFVLQKKHFEI